MNRRTWISLSVAALFVATLLLAIAAVPRTAAAEMCLPEYTMNSFVGYSGCCTPSTAGPRIRKKYFHYTRTCTPDCTCTGWYYQYTYYTCKVDWTCGGVST